MLSNNDSKTYLSEFGLLKLSKRRYFENYNIKASNLIISIIRVSCPRTGLSLQTHIPRLQWSSSANLGTKVAVLLGMNRCGSIPLLFASRSLCSIWTDLKRCEKIPWALPWRWVEWIWLTGPSELHWNSLQELNNSSIRVFLKADQRSGNPNQPSPPLRIYSLKNR